MLLRRNMLVVFLPISLLLLAVNGKTDAVSDARKAIQSAYDKIAAATVKRDIQGMYASHSPDYVTIREDGEKLTLKVEKEQNEVALRYVKSAKIKFVIKTFRLKGKVATVTCAAHSETVFIHPETHKVMSPSIDDGVEQDTWVKTDKGWLLTVSRPLPQKSRNR
jgi:hypothetical protein